MKLQYIGIQRQNLLRVSGYYTNKIQKEVQYKILKNYKFAILGGWGVIPR